MKFKFLHRVGAGRFNWPRRDDLDELHPLCVFYGPLLLENTGPFVVPKQHEIALKKQRKAN